MASNNTSPSQARREPTSPVSPASTSIAVGSTPEEDLYTAVGHVFPGRELSVSLSGAGSHQPSVISSTGATGLAGSYISSATPLSDGQENGAGPLPHVFNPFGEFGTDMDHYPASMTSSIRQHVYEGGLRYHAFRDGQYAFPNDEIEQNRDDMKHTMTLLLCRGKHFYSPVEKLLENGGKLLDLGRSSFLGDAVGLWVAVPRQPLGPRRIGCWGRRGWTTS